MKTWLSEVTRTTMTGRLPSKGLMTSPETLLNRFFSSQDALRNGLVATEVLMWFYIGECIGKGGIIGYNVWILDCHVFFLSFEHCMLNFLQESWESINRLSIVKNTFFSDSLLLTQEACIWQMCADSKREIWMIKMEVFLL